MANVKATGIKTWVRIRPLAKEGEKGHTDGEAVEKQLGEFNEKHVKIKNHDQGGKVIEYDYMSKVFPIGCTQDDVGKEILPGLLNDFWTERNVMIFAYGQTGTGKTTTMFGFPDSLTSETPHEGWGLLPRAVYATLQHNAARARQGIHSLLLLSAVEYYCFMAYDLADTAGKQMCTIKNHSVLGNTYVKCDTPAILREFLERVYGNRKVVATKMNEGSSRSHCALTMTLLTLDASTQRFRQTQLSIIDLAGAERPEKALGTRITKDQALLELWRYLKNPSEDMRPELQGYLVNQELSVLLTEAVTATNSHKAGRKYNPGYDVKNQGALSYLCGALAGEARLGALICLSQSPQNGWETWFSIAKYGEQLAKLHTRVQVQKAVPMEAALKEAADAADEAAAAVANSGSSASAMKYLPYKVGMKVYTGQRLYYMKMLSDMMSGKGGGGGGGEASSGATDAAESADATESANA